MTPEDVLDQLEALLVEERDAIRRLDGAAIDETATLKEQLFAALRESGAAHRRDLVPRLHALIPSLRRNVLLLAHARDCLHDVLVAFRGAVPDPPVTVPSTFRHRVRNTAPRRLSMRG